MKTRYLLPFIVSASLPITAFAQTSAAPSPNAGGASLSRPSVTASPKAEPASSLPPAPSAPEEATLTSLLKNFLAGASKDDVAVHDRFWAEDLIYTSALGRRKGKADIMRELRAESAPKPEDGTAVYTAEEIRIQQYDATAIVAFRLVATTDQAGTKTVAHYLNTGTFLKRNGKWQAVGWQATAMPKISEPAK